MSDDELLAEAERAALVDAFRSSSRSPEHLAFLVEAVVERIVREHTERAWDEGATRVWEPLAHYAYTLGFYLDDNPYRDDEEQS